ncbi:MAG TPA: phage tail protein [Rhodocyclaceae bacterium]|nr:phage tail protein [Rhodocyclaceae bacterium]
MSFGAAAPASKEPSKVLSLRVNQSAYGTAIPRVWGTARLPSNLLWYGDFVGTPVRSQQQGGKGGGGSSEPPISGYSYRAAMALSLCTGPIESVVRVWADKQQFSLGALGFGLANGTLGQSVWSHLSSNHPTEAIGYSGLAYVRASSFELGDQPSAPNLSFEIRGERVSANGDALPHHIISDITTDPLEGLGLAAETLGNLTDYVTWCQAMDFTLSLAMESQSPARDYLRQVLDATLSEAVPSQGKIKIVPYGDEAVGEWAPDDTPVYDLTVADFLSIPIAKGTDPSKAVNRMTLEFVNRERDYNTEPVTKDDQSAVTQYGVRAESKTLHCISRPEMAAVVCEAMRDRALHIRKEITFRVDERFILMEPMDLLTLTYPEQGMNRFKVRVKEINEQDNELEVTVEEWPFGISNPAAIRTQPSSGYVPDLNVAPGNANTPVIFEPPVSLSVEPQIWLATSGGGAWGGAEVWISLDDATYSKIGVISGPMRHGLITANLPSHADVDNVNTLAVDVSASGATLLPATSAARDLFQSLCFVGGELVAYQGATLTGVNRYALTNLRRGAYGSPIGLHLTGAPFARLDGTEFRYTYEPALIGKTIYIKLRSYNRYVGAFQDLADVSATAYVVLGAPLGAVSGLALDRPFTGRAAAWKWSAYPGAATYTVELYNGTQKMRTVTGLTETRYEIDVGQALADGLSRSIEIRVYAVSANGQSSTPAVLLSTNPQCPAPALNVQPMAGMLIASVSAPVDIAGTYLPTPALTAAGVSAGMGVVTKTVATSVWDSQAYSTTSLTARAIATAVPAQANAQIMFGLNVDPGTDANYPSLDYAIYCRADGKLDAYEGGTLRPIGVSYVPGDVLAVIYDGASVRYTRNDATIRSVTAPAGLAMYFDSSFATSGGTLHSIKFGVPPTQSDWPGGAMFWISQDAGFDTTAHAPNYDGTNVSWPSPDIVAGTWYVWAALYDAWGKDSLNITTPFAVSVTAAASGVQRVVNAAAITAPTGSPPPDGDAYWSVYDNLTAKMWMWHPELSPARYTSAVSAADIAGRIEEEQLPLDTILDIDNMHSGLASLSMAVTDETSSRVAAVNQVSARLSSGGDIGGAIVQVQSAAAATAGKVNAAYGVTVDANGYLSGIKFLNDGSTSSVKIAADKVVVAASNIVRDAGFNSSAWWGAGAAWPSNTLPVDGAGSSNQPLRFLRLTAGSVDMVGAKVAVEPGGQYRIRLRVYRSGDFNGRIFVGANIPNVAWAMPGPTRPASEWTERSLPHLRNLEGLNGWATYSAIVGSAADVDWLQTRVTADITAGYCEVALEITRAVGADMVVDGSITAQKVNASFTNTVALQAKQAVIDYASINALSALSTRTGTLTANCINISDDGGGGWGYVRTGNKWWSDGVAGAIIARAGDGSFLMDFQAGSSRIWMSNWGDCGISFPYFSVNNEGEAYFGGTLDACDGRLGFITAGYMQNPSNTTRFNLNATGGDVVLRVGGVDRLWANGRTRWVSNLISSNWSGLNIYAYRITGSYESDGDGGSYWTTTVTRGGEAIIDTGITMDSLPYGSGYEDNYYCTISGWNMPDPGSVGSASLVIQGSVMFQMPTSGGSSWGNRTLHVRVYATVRGDAVRDVMINSVVVNVWRAG